MTLTIELTAKQEARLADVAHKERLSQQYWPRNG